MVYTCVKNHALMLLPKDKNKHNIVFKLENGWTLITIKECFDAT